MAADPKPVALGTPAPPAPVDPTLETEARLRAEILSRVEEIHRLRKAREHFVPGVSKVNYAGRVFEGSPRYLPRNGRPVVSAAAEHLVATARAMPRGEPLYVLALGCVTNIASALRKAPDIAQRIVVVWTSGYPSTAALSNEDSFNLVQDVAASRCLFDSGVPLVYLPGFHVGAQLRLSLAEMDRHVRGRGAIGRYLHHLFTHNPLWTIHPVDTTRPYTWVIWDLICVAWVMQPDWVPSRLVRTPRLDARLHWQADGARPLMREAHAVQRDAIFNDFFARLDAHAAR